MLLRLRYNVQIRLSKRTTSHTALRYVPCPYQLASGAHGTDDLIQTIYAHVNLRRRLYVNVRIQDSTYDMTAQAIPIGKKIATLQGLIGTTYGRTIN